MDLILKIVLHYLPLLFLAYILYMVFIHNVRKKKYTRIENKRLQKVVITKLTCAFTLYERLTGLLNHHSLPIDEALLIEPAHRIHTKGMHFPIDVIFIDKVNKVIALIENIAPEENTCIFPKKQYAHKGTRKVLELASRGAKLYDFRVGDELVFK